MLKNKLFKSLYSYSVIIVLCMLMSTWSLFGADTTKIWVGTWITAPQLVEPGNMPPSPGLTNNSLRQVVRVSIGGDTLQVRFSNEFSTSPVTMKSVQIAVSAGGNAINDITNIELTFSGNPEVTMDPGTAITSDPIAFDLEPRTDIAITIYFGSTSADVTGHPGSRTTSYLLAGNNTAMTDFTGALLTDHWYVINGIDVLAPSTSTCVAILGNSITGGRGSVTNMQNRWPDYLSEYFLTNPGTQQVGVLNAGIGGNCVLRACLGPSGIDRFERDILNQHGVRSAIIFEGVNDIGTGVGSNAAVASVANGLIAAYKMMIDSAHSRGIMIYGATISPFKGNGYYSQYSEVCRNKVNEWIRTSGRFDAVIDFDKALRDSQDTASLVSSYQNDGLHPDTSGYRKMIESIDLKLFEGLDTIFPIDTSKTESLWIEPECAIVGKNWKLKLDSQVSNQIYVAIEPGFSSLSTAPEGEESIISIPFTLSKDSTYCIFAHLNCPSTSEDSYWVSMDRGEFVLIDGLVSSGWEWKELSNYVLTAGEHILTIAYSEDGTNLDKLCITNDMTVPTAIDISADIVCFPDTAGLSVGMQDVKGGLDHYTMGQNYPNPFTDLTTIPFEIPRDTFVSLKVYSILGEEITEHIGKEYDLGKHSVEFDASGLSKGIYLYTIKTDEYSATRKMIIQTE